jgi:FAD/FMN-containing dehydrogenase
VNRHHFRFVLRQWMEHQNPANLRLHVWSNGAAWLAMTTVLSQVPVPVAVPLLGPSLGAWFVALSVLYWLPADPLTAVLVGLFTVGWAHLPVTLWGPGSGVLLGAAIPLTVFVAAGLSALIAHIYYHEHASYFAGEPRGRAALETTHAVLWGPFHFWLEALVRRGWRPTLRRQLDEAERAAILGRQDVPWQNWAGNVTASPAATCVPRTVEELSEVVRAAATAGRKVRAVASGFTWSGFAATDDVLVCCERLNDIEIDTSNPAQPTVWVGPGVMNRDLNAALARHDLMLPYNVVMETVRVGGIVSLGTHGSGRDTGTLGDLIEAAEVITATGERRLLSEATVGAETMRAVKLSFGMFGILARIQLKVVPAFRVIQRDRLLPRESVLESVRALVDEHDAVDLYWFPFTDKIWVRTADRTDAPSTHRGHGRGFLALNFFQMLLCSGWLRGVVRRLPRLTPHTWRGFLRVMTFRDRVLTQAEAQHCRRWLELFRCRCVEVAFKLDPQADRLREAWAAMQELVDDWAARGKYPLNVAVNARFIGSSDALLSPAFGEGVTCYIEALSAEPTEGWTEFSAELSARWLTIPGALPHWAKEFEHVPGIVEIARERLGERLERFLDALESAGTDPDGMFVNPLINRLLLEPIVEEAAKVAA